jgi:hypothetical protein
MLGAALTAGAATLTLSGLPSTNAISMNDDVIINVTNAGTGTWTTKRTRIGNLFSSVSGSNATYSGSVSVAGDGIYSVRQYGATGSGTIVTGVIVTASSQTLNAAAGNFTAADAGKVICIYSAGTNGQSHTTGIQSVNSATQLILSNAPATSANGVSAVYGWDDTTAIQAALNAAASKRAGTVFFPEGIYVINGPVVDAGQDRIFYPNWGLSNQQVFVDVPNGVARFNTLQTNDWAVGDFVQLNAMTPSYYNALFQITNTSPPCGITIAVPGTVIADGTGTAGTTVVRQMRNGYRKNAQLYIPDIPIVGNHCGTITLKGISSPTFISFNAQTPYAFMSASGSILWSTLPNLNSGSVISCELTNSSSAYRGWFSGADGQRYFNNFRLGLEDLHIRLAGNPQGSAVDARAAYGLEARGVFIDAGYPLYGAPQPTYTNSAALMCPGIFNAGPNRIGNVNIAGFYNGLVPGEMMAGDGFVFLMSCYNAVNLGFASGHMNTFDSLVVSSCHNWIVSPYGHNQEGGIFRADMFGESTYDSWDRPAGYLVDDPYNTLSGEVSISYSAQTGYPIFPTVRGATRMVIRYYGTPAAGYLLQHNFQNYIGLGDSTVVSNTVTFPSISPFNPPIITATTNDPPYNDTGLRNGSVAMTTSGKVYVRSNGWVSLNPTAPSTVNADNITSGTLADARLSTNVVTKSGLAGTLVATNAALPFNGYISFVQNGVTYYLSVHTNTVAGSSFTSYPTNLPGLQYFYTTDNQTGTDGEQKVWTDTWTNNHFLTNVVVAKMGIFTNSAGATLPFWPSGKPAFLYDGTLWHTNAYAAPDTNFTAFATFCPFPGNELNETAQAAGMWLSEGWTIGTVTNTSGTKYHLKGGTKVYEWTFSDVTNNAWTGMIIVRSNAVVRVFDLWGNALTNTAVATAFGTTRPPSIGATPQASYFFKGLVTEMGYCNTNISDAQIVLLRNYLRTNNVP